MKLIVDTQCWLWLQTDTKRFSKKMREMLADPETALHLSSASCWEIAIKYALGKLPLPSPPSDYVPSRMRISGTLPLPITAPHALRVAELPHLHRDPFDRLLVAQSQIEQLPILTADPFVRAYAVETLAPR